MSENFAKNEYEKICFYPAVGMMCVSGGCFFMPKMKILKNEKENDTKS